MKYEIKCCTSVDKPCTMYNTRRSIRVSFGVDTFYNVQHNLVHFRVSFGVHILQCTTQWYIGPSFGVHQSHFLSAPSWNTPLTLQTINLILYVFVFVLYFYLYLYFICILFVFCHIILY